MDLALLRSRGGRIALLADLAGDSRPVGYECAGLRSTNEIEGVRTRKSIKALTPGSAMPTIH